MGGGPGEIGLADALMEGEGFALHAIGGGVAAVAGEAGGGVEVKDDRHVGMKAAGGDLVHALDEVGAKIAGDALVGPGGKLVAVGEDDAAGVKGGAKDLGDVLGAVGAEDEELGERRHRLVGAEDDLAKGAAGGGGARLEGGDDVEAERAEAVGEEADLGWTCPSPRRLRRR